MVKMQCAFLVTLLILFFTIASEAEEKPFMIGVFDVDVSPPVGSPLAYDPCDSVAMPLHASGIVLQGDEHPVVLCAVDWIGIANAAHQEWCRSLADAVGTTVDRVTVHTLHQHDAPFCDFSSEAILAERGREGQLFDVKFAQRVIERVAQAAKEAAKDPQAVTHLGLGKAVVEKVASNRRILGADGKVRATRYTACRDPELRNAPEGVIDPMLKSISFWNENQPIAVLTYYATHPQSYYRKGIANPDFPGMARYLRQVTLNGVPHVHFNGAGGNIGAGKYNDGSPDNRQVLAIRMAKAMAEAFQSTERHPVSREDLHWRSTPVALPAAKHLSSDNLLATLDSPTASALDRKSAATDLAWLRRCQSGHKINIGCLRLGPARVLHLPGEPVIEYQLFAQEIDPTHFTAVAGYGDYGTGYICLAEHYDQGGYESSPRASRVAPEVERVLKKTMEELLTE